MSIQTVIDAEASARATHEGRVTASARNYNAQRTAAQSFLRYVHEVHTAIINELPEPNRTLFLNAAKANHAERLQKEFDSGWGS